MRKTMGVVRSASLRAVLVAAVPLLVLPTSCGSEKPTSTIPGTGGLTGSGGASGSGGVAGSGGLGSGGSRNSGGQVGTGGSSSVGGSSTRGGASGTGGVGMGGATGSQPADAGADSRSSGGASGDAAAKTGGVPGSGGALGTGGTASGGGATGAGGTQGTGGTSSGRGGANGTGGTGGGGSGGTTSGTGGAQAYKPRIIVTTDGEVDDRSSMVRFLMYASDYDVVGLVQVNSKYQKSGHSGEKWVEKEIDLYDQVLPNLRKHNPDYPDASKLRSAIKVGNENSADLTRSPPDFATKDTPGAQLIIDTLLDKDPRPVHVPSWGGANTTAYALYKLKTSYTQAEFDYAVSRIRIYCIWYQDAGGQWIEDNIPGARIYEAYKWDNVWDYQSLSGPSPEDVKTYMTESWLNTNVKEGHGPLGKYTPQDFISEGDTPSFLPLINNGLDQHLDYTLGGWGGRPVYDKGTHMTDGSDDGNGNKPFWRWIPTLQNDFAARMDWCVASSYAGANHNPKAKVAGGLERQAAAGETVALDASPTTDPDGNALTYKWWQYADADSASAKVTIDGASSATASLKVPNEPGKQLHVILEVTDDGKPPLTHYQRVTISIR